MHRANRSTSWSSPLFGHPSDLLDAAELINCSCLSNKVGTKASNKHHDIAMASVKSKAELQEVENRQKRRTAEKEYKTHLAMLEGFMKDKTQWSNTGKSMGVEYEELKGVGEVTKEPLKKHQLGKGGSGKVIVVYCRDQKSVV